MTEAELEEQVRDLCNLHKVTRVHHRHSQDTHPGWPDDVLIGTLVLYRELKTNRGKITSAQEAMHAELAAAGADVAVWRPEDLLSGRIQREIAAIARRS